MLKKLSKIGVMALVAALLLPGFVMASSQGVDDDTITVGSVGVTSGPAAFIGQPYYQGMRSYFRTVNDEGGVLGREIELIQKDDEFDPAQSRDYIQELIYDEEVFAIVGQLGTPGVISSAQIVKDSGIPSVYFGSGATELTELGENFFPVQPNYVYEGKLMSKYAVEHFEADNIAVLYQNDDVGRDGIQGIREGLAELGMEDRLNEDAVISHNPSESDYTAQMQKILVQDPDMVIVFSLSQAASLIVRAAEDFGLEAPMLTTYSNADASFLATIQPSETAPNAILNLHVMGWLDVDDESLAPLVNAMEAYYPDGNLNAYTMAGWVAGETFVAGLRNLEGDITWDNYIESMNNLKFTDGLAAEISFAPGVRQGVTQMAVSKVVEEDGEYFFEQLTDFMEF
ncbi:MAG: ABC transporter substrate-binding protein [Halarsenatibacteraceae bacterium]